MVSMRDGGGQVKSGLKYATEQGTIAIKDGAKNTSNYPAAFEERKPSWLRMSLKTSPAYGRVKEIVKSNRLSTVCEEAKCPNVSECWSHGTATIMLLGSVCTRACKFCAVDTGNPRGFVDNNEPENAARSVALMQLKYVVLTSVDRDDLPDLGAGHYARTIELIKKTSPGIRVEALVPDFQGRTELVDLILASQLDVFAQNVETVRRLTQPVRDIRAGYEQTLDVLKYAKIAAPHVLTKTSLMLGLGEEKSEVVQTMVDLKEIGCDIVTFGQYLRPTKNHLPVIRYVTPAEFAEYREIGLKIGFLEVVSGPLVRSSYRADKVFELNNVGL